MAAQTNTVNLNTYKAKILSNSYGANNSPIYFNDGVPTILTTIGGQYEPVWVDNGVITAITAGTTAQFYRGDKSWSNEISGGLFKITNNNNTVTIGSNNANYCHFSNSADIPFYFNKLVWIDGNLQPYGTTSTKNLGTSSKYWKDAYITTTHGDLNGNADTATKIKVTNLAFPSSGSQTYYLTLAGSTTTGNQDIKDSTHLYLYENTTTSYLNIGSSGTNGGLTLWKGTGHVDIVPTTITANTTRNHYLPNVTGWIAVGGNGTNTGVGGQYAPVYLSTSGVLTEITAGTTAQFYRGDKSWSNTLTGAIEAPILKLHQGTAANPSLTGNARIEFDYTSGQPVVISYTPQDSYRAPAGLKVMGGTSATPAWFEVEGELITGMRQVTSGPSSITYANRLTIVPYFHTGGPWYIKSGDDASNAYLALYYSSTQLMRIKHDGTQMVDWKGNASTATKLATARAINGTNFDGSAAITTANWGTARTITIGATGKSINGSANVSWSKTEIIGSGTTAQFLRGDHAWSSTLVGTLTVNALDVAGAGLITFANSGSWGNSSATFPNARGGLYWGGTSDWVKLFCEETASDNFNLIADFGDDTSPSFILRDRGTNKITIHPGSSTITATTFSGNAATATKLQTARKIWGQDFDGSGNVDGLLKITANSNTVTIGSANSSWCHIQNSASIPFYFNPSVCVDGDVYPYTNNARSCGTSSRKWASCYATNFYGALTGNVTGNCSGSAGSVAWANVGSKPATATRWPTWNEIGDGADGLSEGTSNWTDNTEILTSYASNNGFADTNAKGKVYRRDAVCAYNYIKSKASGSWTISVTGSSGSCTGNAATATNVAWSGITSKPTQWDASTAATLSAGLPTPRSTGHAYLCGNGVFISGPYTSNDCGWIRCTSSSENDFELEIATGDDGGAGESIVCRQYNTSNAVAHAITLMDHSGYSTFIRAYNAVWNDYAECRKVETTEPGYCVMETTDGKMVKTTRRLQPGCKITSDTFGTCMGETETAKTPVAVAGRVLVYPYKNRNEYSLGAAVCSAPNGTVDIMTRDEIMMYPERIVGTVSEIPNYDTWYGGTKENPTVIQVDGRIWIYVK